MSLAAGAALFSLAQVRDLFFDFPGVGGLALSNLTWPVFSADYLWPLGNAISFALLVTLFWAMCTHSVARLAVTDSAWLKSPYGVSRDDAEFKAMREAFATPAACTPRVLGALCFMIPAVFAIGAGYDLWGSGGQGLAERAYLNLFLIVVALTGFGAFFLIYMRDRRKWYNAAMKRWRGGSGRRIALVEEAPQIGGRQSDPEVERAVAIDTWIARFIFWALVAALAAPHIIESHFPRLWLVPILLGAWVPLLGFVARRSHAARAPLILCLVILIGLLDIFIGDDHHVDLIDPPDAADASPINRQIDLSQAIQVWRDVNGCGENDVNKSSRIDACPSPIIVATTGGASRAAFFTVTALGLLLDATCRVSPDNGVTPLALQRDATLPCPDEPIFAKRLFALSGVSGGAVGSAFFVKALDSARLRLTRDYGPPCPAPPKKDRPVENPPFADSAENLVNSTLYFGAANPARWRECLQAMLAEDFLTPVMAGLGFRDALAFLGRLLPFWIDRGHRLEAALAGAYAKFAASKDLDPGDAGMRAPFLSIAQPFPPRADDGRKIWRPLLLLNATSVESGRRFVFSALAPRYWPSQDPRESVNWLTDSYDFHEVVDVDHDQRQRDASLATAAHNSARFPVVSPAGDLYPHWRDRANRGRLFGHLDDGGYFDNFGAITAHDLAVALGQEGLRPFIILITNDPSSAPTQPFAPTGAKGGSWAGAAPPQPDLTGQTWWRFSSSLETVLATRSAHGDYGVQTLRRLIDPAVNDGNLRPQTATCFNADGGSEKRAEPCFAQLAVYPEIEGDGTPAQKTTSGGVAGRVRDISMSWWASKLVQEYLDEQIISHENTSTDSTQKRQSTNKDIEFAECRNRQAYYTICRAMFPSETNGARECIRSIDAQTNLLPDQRRDCD